MTEEWVTALVVLLTLLVTAGSVVAALASGLLATVVPIAAVLGSGYLLRQLAGGGGAGVSGPLAPAQVLSLADTGLTMNASPQVRLRLQVLPRDGAPFETTLLTFLPRLDLARYQHGALVQVRVDAARPQTVALVGPLGAVEAYAPEGGVAPPLVPLLHRLLASAEVSLALGQAPERPAQVLALRPLGLRVAGANPFCQVERVVEGDPAARQAEGVLSALTLDRYQPGATVWVKVDPTDPSRVALSRSA